jgi:endonuclease/exonuclease/phosphatase family metal-dependent hydrolase
MTRAPSAAAPLRRLITAVAAALVAASILGSPAAGAPKAQPIKVMTLNAYLGSDLRAVLDARSIPELLSGAAAVYRQVQANDFPSRGQALAALIRDAAPTVIGVQEASKWLTGEPGVLDGPATPAENVAYDYLELLLDALADGGTPYQAYETRVEFDGEVPSALGFDVRLIQRDAILIRSDVPSSELTVLDSASGNFVANEPIVVGGVSVPVNRGWSSVDVLANQRAIRVVNTHLEPEDATLRLEQARELVATGGPTDTSIPVILVGDLNSGPSPADSAAYDAVLAGGFRDAWTEVHGDDEGFTCCQSANLSNPVSQLNRRIDVILFDAGKALQAKRYGMNRASRTVTGLWPSDHASVVATIGP